MKMWATHNVTLVVLVPLVLLYPCGRASGQVTIDDLSSLLGSDLQTYLSDLTSLTTGETTTTEETDTTGGAEEEAVTLPLGHDALYAALADPPGTYVRKTLPRVGDLLRAALAGTPTFGPDEVVLPEDEPDFWDRVKRTFLIGLADAVVNWLVPVEDPVLSPTSSTFQGEITVSMSASSEEATIYYTLDGTTPTEDSNEYAEPITITQTTTVTARAFEAGRRPSDAVEETYTLEEAAAEKEASE